MLNTCTHTHLNMHAHTGPCCIVKRSAEEEEGKLAYLLLLGRQPVFIFHSFHMHLPSSPFILSSSRGEETHQRMFSFTVIGWFKAASVNCAPLPTALHLLGPPPPSSLSPTLRCLLLLSELLLFKVKLWFMCESVDMMILTDSTVSTVKRLKDVCMLVAGLEVPRLQYHLPALLVT